MRIIGIDCATQPAKTGLVLGELRGESIVLTEAVKPSRARPAATVVAEWLGESGPTLLALDAPLGWPTLLGERLRSHNAGDLLDGDADRLFHRGTDDRVRERFGKPALEVGANLIARTAHAALRLLHDVAQAIGVECPYKNVREVFDAIAQAVGPYAGLSYDTLGHSGELTGVAVADAAE